MAENYSDKFVSYLRQIATAMIDSHSAHQSQRDHIADEFKRYGLSNEQYAQAIVQLEVSMGQITAQVCGQNALDLIKLETEGPLREAELEIKKMEVKIKEKDLEMKDKDLQIKDKELQIKDKELDMIGIEVKLKEQELEIRKQELEIKKQELEIAKEELKLKAQLLEESRAKTCLIKEQCVTEQKQQVMMDQQEKLVKRQTDGYDDNLMVKAAEYQSGLASFAVNAGANSANDAIKEFNITIAELKRRAAYDQQ